MRGGLTVRVVRRPLFKWMPGVEDGTWVLCFGPQCRYRLGGVLAHKDHLALMLGDTAQLNRGGLQWFDRLSRDPDFQRRWRTDWPTWLWPRDVRPVKPLVLELAQKDGITPRLASNAAEWAAVWAERRVEAMRPKQLRLFVKKRVVLKLRRAR